MGSLVQAELALGSKKELAPSGSFAFGAWFLVPKTRDKNVTDAKQIVFALPGRQKFALALLSCQAVACRCTVAKNLLPRSQVAKRGLALFSCPKLRWCCLVVRKCSDIAQSSTK